MGVRARFTLILLWALGAWPVSAAIANAMQSAMLILFQRTMIGLREDFNSMVCEDTIAVNLRFKDFINNQIARFFALSGFNQEVTNYRDNV